MEDMRLYKDIIKRAVAIERGNDRHSWRVCSVTKSVAKIGWSYLDDLCRDKEKTVAFSVCVQGTGDALCVVGNALDGSTHHEFIGPHRWDDAPTIGEGIFIIIRVMAAHMRRVY